MPTTTHTEQDMRNHQPSMGVMEAERKDTRPEIVKQRKTFLRVLASDIRRRNQLTPWSQDATDKLLRMHVDGMRETREYRVAERYIAFQDRLIEQRRFQAEGEGRAA